MNLTPAWLGVIRGLGTVIVMAVLTYLGDAVHLNGIVSPILATLIASVCLGIEHSMEDTSGTALFGTARVRH